MLTSHILAVRIAVAALIWASVLLAPAAAAQFDLNVGAPKNGVASIGRPRQVCASTTALGAPPAGQISYRYDMPDVGPPMPGPTDPNAPSSW